MPDKPHPIRALAASALREGRPVAPAELGDAWGALEAAILVDPAFAASYRALCEIAGDHGPGPWIAAAPRKPGDVDEPLLWTFVALPANLVALELVSGGAHATYFFRVVPRHSWTGTLPAGAAEETVAAVSDALVDARFLREPLALPDERLGEPANVRYRLALAALPSLAAARRCFVARVVHRDAETWRSAVEDLVAWHARATDDEARWPGRAAQEALVAAASDG